MPKKPKNPLKISNLGDFPIFEVNFRDLIPNPERWLNADKKHKNKVREADASAL